MRKRKSSVCGQVGAGTGLETLITAMFNSQQKPCHLKLMKKRLQSPVQSASGVSSMASWHMRITSLCLVSQCICLQDGEQYRGLLQAEHRPGFLILIGEVGAAPSTRIFWVEPHRHAHSRPRTKVFPVRRRGILLLMHQLFFPSLSNAAPPSRYARYPSSPD